MVGYEPTLRNAPDSVGAPTRCEGGAATMILSLGVLGALAGVAVAAVAASYGADRRFWPWPRQRVRRHDAATAATATPA